MQDVADGDEVRHPQLDAPAHAVPFQHVVYPAVTGVRRRHLHMVGVHVVPYRQVRAIKRVTLAEQTDVALVEEVPLVEAGLQVR